MLSIFPQLFTYQQIAPLILRVVLGIIFLVHGYPKFFKQFSGTVQFFDSVGIRPAKFWVFVVGAVEFFGGIALILGIFTQIAAGLIAVNMLVAILKVKKAQGFAGGYEFDLILMAAAISLLFLGPGIFAFDLPL